MSFRTISLGYARYLSLKAKNVSNDTRVNER